MDETDSSGSQAPQQSGELTAITRAYDLVWGLGMTRRVGKYAAP